MKIRPTEVRLAWGIAAVLGIASWLTPPGNGLAYGGIALGILASAYLVGAILLSTTEGCARVTGGLECLLGDSVGRVSLIVALALAILVGFISCAFSAFVLTGAFCSILWVADRRSGATPWWTRFPLWILSGSVLLLLLGVAEGLLAMPPIAERFGTPTELAQWNRRYPGLWTRNLFRFRSVYEDTQRRSGTRRVIALGDSFTWGSKIASPDSTWPALLEQLLVESPGGVPTEVINMGERAFGTVEEADRLRRIGWQFDPDLVILQWLNNDADWGPDRNVVLVPESLRTGWIRRSALLAMIESVLSTWREPVLAHTRRAFAPDSPGWLQAKQALREMGDSAQRRRTPALLVLYPYLFPGRWTEDTYPERDVMAMVAAEGRRAGFEVLDLTAAFAEASAGRDWREWWTVPYDSHPSGNAQLVAAKAIAKYLGERGLLSPTGGGRSGTS